MLKGGEVSKTFNWEQSFSGPSHQRWGLELQMNKPYNHLKCAPVCPGNSPTVKAWRTFPWGPLSVIVMPALWDDHTCTAHQTWLNRSVSLKWAIVTELPKGYWESWVFAFLRGAVLEFELKASCLLGRCSTTWATPPSPFLCWVFLR
jgi:hypothetical protein